MVLLHQLLHLVDDHAALVHGHGDELRLVDAHGLNRAQEGGALHQNHVAGIDQRLQKQIEGLGGALHRQDVVRRAAHARSAAQVVRNARPQTRQALGSAVLQGVRAVAVDGLAGQVPHHVRLQRAVGRIAARKGDHARFAQELKDVADRAAGDVLHLTGKIFLRKAHMLSPSPYL